MIIRFQKGTENPYVMIRKDMFEDPDLSLKAKGLLGYILTKPDDWKIYIDEFAARLKENRHTVGRIFQELIDNGYCERNEIRGEDGRFEGYDYTVYEVRNGKTYSLEKNTVDENRPRSVVDYPPTVNRPLLKTDLTKKIEEEEIRENADDIDNELEPQNANVNSSSSLSTTKEKIEDLQLIGEINNSRPDWSESLFYNSTLQTEFDRLRTEGRTTDGILELAKREDIVSPGYFIIGLKTYRGSNGKKPKPPDCPSLSDFLDEPNELPLTREEGVFEIAKVLKSLARKNHLPHMAVGRKE